MSTVTLGGNAVQTSGDLPQIGAAAPAFTLVKTDLSEIHLSDYAGKRVILNIFPSIDTPTCATSVRMFNHKAAQLENTAILCISRDLPFAIKRFCGAEGIENVYAVSDFREGQFGKDYGLEFVTGPLKGLHARSVIVVDTDGKVIYTELVPEVANEPNYEQALAGLK
ncbi:thiol peroxidase [Flavobacterium sp.]|uniref:thiol peroxidase n=1 Tax=Flavobacterium sp. TaxID=239 RepID=UPI003B9C0C97